MSENKQYAVYLSTAPFQSKDGNEMQCYAKTYDPEQAQKKNQYQLTIVNNWMMAKGISNAINENCKKSISTIQLRLPRNAKLDLLQEINKIKFPYYFVEKNGNECIIRKAYEDGTSNNTKQMFINEETAQKFVEFVLNGNKPVVSVESLKKQINDLIDQIIDLKVQ